jgi:hypothetical protein
MSKITLLLAAGAGYVLGARAGRERYEKISAQSEQLWQDPRVQKYVDQAKGAAGQKAREAAEATKSKIAGASDDEHGADVTTARPPDSFNDTTGTSGSGPQGTLP